MSESEIEVDREYIVPLTRAWITPRHQRSARAVRVLREFAVRHMKSSDVKIDTEISEAIWSRGITKPPRKIKVRMTKDEDGLVRISLPKEETKESEVEESTDKSAGEEPAPEEKETSKSKEK
jgi:large subunit ribosomal protein L31e